MNKKNFIYLATLLFVVAIQFQSCKQEEIKSYSSGNSLFFERTMTINGARVRVDTMDVSFSHYVGKDNLSLPFSIKLIGNVLSEDKEYKVKVVEDMTTAKLGQYSYPEKLIFRKGLTTDSLYITIYRDKMAKDEEVVLTLSLVENENFGLGYATYENIKLRFNNKIAKPLWWKDEIEKVFFGTYSYKKYVTIADANPGFTSAEGLTQTQIREIAITTQDYISANNVTEEDGTPMKMPIY